MVADTPRRPHFRLYPAVHAFFGGENLLGTYDPEQAAKAWDVTIGFLRSICGSSYRFLAVRPAGPLRLPGACLPV